MDEHKKLRIKQLVLALALPLAVSGLSAILTHGDMRLFAEVEKPPLAPPMWLFPVAWTLLYMLMGYASYRVLVADATEIRKRRALTVYAVQLAVNFLWPLVFFKFELFLAAFIVLTALWVLAVICMAMFYYICEAAGVLLIPYVLWLSFAAYLNLGIYLLNK